MESRFTSQTNTLLTNVGIIKTEDEYNQKYFTHSLIARGGFGKVLKVKNR